MRRLSLILLPALLCAACHNSDTGSMPDMTPRVDPFKPVPECEPGTLLVTPLQGDRQILISSLKIADFNEGFDLNGDGKKDNKLAPLGSVGNSAIMTAFQFAHNIIIPIELFGYKGMDSDCTKFAFYLGRYNEDKDGDGKDTEWTAGKCDCDDTNPLIHSGAMEDLMNRVDDDCDGIADNMPKAMATDTMDLDGDGFSPAMGDCDDRMAEPIAAMRHPGAKDVCGSGIDFNCDGIADKDPTCDPFADNKVSVHLTAISFGDNMAGMPLQLDGGVPDGGSLDVTGHPPLIVFNNGNVKGGTLNAGPSLFALSLPFQSDLNITLTLTGAHMTMVLDDQPLGTYVRPQTTTPNGLLGGVLEAVSLAQIRNLNIGGVLKPDQSLLDAVFAGPVATILGLDTDKDGHYLPDIDVDGDGIETFWQENMMTTGPDGGAPEASVDTCKDGDGTIVKNNFDGNGTQCALAKDDKGNYRFVDGLSVALKFSAVPVKIKDIVIK
jgi:hypothetical protein